MPEGVWEESDGWLWRLTWVVVVSRYQYRSNLEPHKLWFKSPFAVQSRAYNTWLAELSKP